MGKKVSKTMKMLSSKSCTLCLLIVLLVGVLVYFYSINLKESFTNDDTDFGTGKKLVLFYADWCGHCNTLKPQWNKAAKQTKNSNVRMVKVNCGEDDKKHQDIVNRYDIQGFPTIKLLNNGKVESDYDGKRDSSSLVTYVNSL